ncbi:TraR/DksA family transcriptional regulator [Vogesella sp. XCS3]|uniref:TraR/DksA family transcriptional regulator n=1 Tax=Vogesella sp. XCS3 TaxID=2877939 RepID=UPI001D0B2102|nr:TraR/DksA family transcriptional regulator [Vogesella sp. XCS3]UDM18950.1 TraR/DksA family transcriptional regulator [Vogesella sp. XCS3]
MQEYMTQEQTIKFKEMLLDLQQQLREELPQLTAQLATNENAPDPTDRASMEEERIKLLTTRERSIAKLCDINIALEKLEAGEYGYCEDTGDEIGLQRLMANPMARLCVEAQERRENMGRQYAS